MTHQKSIGILIIRGQMFWLSSNKPILKCWKPSRNKVTFNTSNSKEQMGTNIPLKRRFACVLNLQRLPKTCLLLECCIGAKSDHVYGSWNGQRPFRFSLTVNQTGQFWQWLQSYFLYFNFCIQINICCFFDLVIIYL